MPGRDLRLRGVAAGCAAAIVLAWFPADVQGQRRAAVRASAPPAHVAVRPYYPRYYPYYRSYPYPYYRSYPYYSFGFGYYGYPYGYFGLGWYYGQPFPPYYGYGPYYGAYYGGGFGSLRLQVTPRDTEVFIDGYFAGTADDFDGTFQRLNVDPGDHAIELFHPQRRSVRQEIYLQPDKTFTMKLDMSPLAAGDPAPVRPTVSQTSSNQNPSGQTPDPQDQRPRDLPRGPGGSRQSAVRTGSEFGAVSLRAQPRDAEVVIDGQRWEGSTDGDRLVVELAPGVHLIEIQKDGFRTYRTERTVRRGETTIINVALAPN